MLERVAILEPVGKSDSYIIQSLQQKGEAYEKQI